MATKLTPAEHHKQIDAYTKERPIYKVYASVLERVLRQACSVSAPEALVQSRAKTVSSFAEKCARKFEKYSDPVHQFTDLCGARVIVQTFEQVQAVRQFIEANFTIVEKEDKGLLLHEDEFGYRDMHYIVQLIPDGNIDIKSSVVKTVGKRKAEIQVRTWVQHAWADTLHDRLYKTKLKFSPEIRRTGSLLSAIMEDGDRTFSRLALEVDGMLANYSAYASKDEVGKEIKILNLILANERDKAKKQTLALQIARLLSASGAYDKVVEVLKPFEKIKGTLRCEVLLHLGYALCKKNRGGPYESDTPYAKGQELLREAAGICQRQDLCEVPNLRKRQSLYALANARLGWSYEPMEEEKHRARQYYLTALEFEPSNPYYLAEVLGYEISYSQHRGLAASVRAAIMQAIKTCSDHALAGTEMPYACYTAGRLALLLWDGEDSEKAIDCSHAALAWYARGIHHCLSESSVLPPDVLKSEIAWLRRVNFGHKMPEWQSWIRDFLLIADKLIVSASKKRGRGAVRRTKRPAVSKQILVVAGAAASASPGMLKRIRPMLYDALANFSGKVIAGGTTVGVPGCVGDIAKKTPTEVREKFRLIGYVKEKPSPGARWHSAYDELKRFGERFSPAHLLRYWQDIMADGVSPEDLLLLGFGGGKLSALEYRMALALGASVGVVIGTGGAVDEILNDPHWSTLKNLYPLPFDRGTIRAFVVPATERFTTAELEEMAMCFHSNFLDSSSDRLPPNMRKWCDLDETYRDASLEQAKYSVEILRAAGFDVRKDSRPVILRFTEKEKRKIELMAEMEHGRWNVERLRAGWRFGKPRDNSRNLHDCLVSWAELPDKIKPLDRVSVKAFPEILAKAGFEVFR